MVTGVDLAVYSRQRNNLEFQGFIAIVPDMDLDAGSRLEFSVRMPSGEGEERFALTLPGDVAAGEVIAFDPVSNAISTHGKQIINSGWSRLDTAHASVVTTVPGHSSANEPTAEFAPPEMAVEAEATGAVAASPSAVEIVFVDAAVNDIDTILANIDLRSRSMSSIPMSMVSSTWHLSLRA
jgi:hypothetical protein